MRERRVSANVELVNYIENHDVHQKNHKEGILQFLRDSLLVFNLISVSELPLFVGIIPDSLDRSEPVLHEQCEEDGCEELGNGIECKVR